eukprot:gene12096-gene12955
MVTLVRLQRQLFLGLQLFFLQLLYFAREHGLRRSRRVDTRRLDRNHEVTTSLEEVMRIQRHDTSLVRLCHVRENCVHHTHQHTILQRVSGVFDDRNDVRARLRHVDQVATRSERELDCIYTSRRTHNVRHVRYRGTGRTTEIVNVVHTTQNRRRNLRSERIPHTVLQLRGVAVRSRRTVHLDALLAIHILAGSAVQRHQRIFLATGDEHALVTMRLDHDLGTALHATTTATSTAASATTSTAASATTAAGTTSTVIASTTT